MADRKDHNERDNPRPSASWMRSLLARTHSHGDKKSDRPIDNAQRPARDVAQGDGDGEGCLSEEGDGDGDLSTSPSHRNARRKARHKSDKDPNLLQRAARSAQHYGASLLEGHHRQDQPRDEENIRAEVSPPISIPSDPLAIPRSRPGPHASSATALSSSPSMESQLSSSPLTPSSSPRPSPQQLSGSFKGVSATLNTLHSRYSMRRQASQTFKDMQVKQSRAVDDGVSSPSLSSASVDRQSGGPMRSASLDTATRDSSASGGSIAVLPHTSPHASPRPSMDATQSDSNIARIVNTPSTIANVTSSPPQTVPLLDVPKPLQTGETMLKVTHKKVMQRIIRLDADRGQILWASKKGNRINLEAVREVRIGASGASFRTSLNISAAHEPRWISIIYQQGAAYKALHLIALTDESLARWRDALERLHGLRRQLLGGSSGARAASSLGLDVADLQNNKNDIWLRQHWKTADSTADEKLDLDEVVRLCRRLGIESTRKDLRRRFDQADWRRRGYLDFEDFQLFVRLLKRRSDAEHLFAEWADTEVRVKDAPVAAEGSGRANAPASGTIDSAAAATGYPAMSLQSFTRFMEEEQEVSHDAAAAIYGKYCNKVHSTLLLDGFLSFLQSSDNCIVRDATLVLPMDKDGDAAAPKMLPQPQRQARAEADTAEQLLAAEAQTTTNSTCSGQARVAPQAMDRPLSEYFISSSHNTYLVGGQWKGDSTVEGYIRALQHGARSVELDCWDGPHGQPQITHGRTLTSRVAFLDVITAIAKYAFVTSPYPLILSLEVHNDVPQQTVMAKMLRDVLGAALVTKKLPETTHAGGGSTSSKPGYLSSTLPSPEELRGRILVKAKNILISSSSNTDADNSDKESTAFVMERQYSSASTTSNAETTGSESDGFLSNAKDLVRTVARGARSHSGVDGKSGKVRGSEVVIGPGLLPSQSTSAPSGALSGKAKKVIFSPDLAALLVYTIGVKHRGINKKETYAPEHMISLSERTAFKYVRDRWNREDLIKHNRSHLTRVYPSMSSLARLHASANYLPHHIWAVGCQLVALNWQTVDLGFALNQAMFNRNAGTGYVLKPSALRFKAPSTAVDTTRCTLEIEIISAQQLPRFRDVVRDKERSADGDVLDPFIAVSLFTPESWGKQVQEGIGESTQRHSTQPQSPPTQSTPRSARQATHVIRGNGFNPIWNSTLRFSIQVPTGDSVDISTSISDSARVHQVTRGLLDLAFLRFEVCEDTTGEGKSSSYESADSSSTSSSQGQTTAIPVDTTNLTPSQILATYTISIGALQMGYRHLPLYDGQLQQYPFSTLFVRSKLRVVGGLAGAPS